MKYLLVPALLGLSLAPASALPLYEPFNYTAGLNLIGQINPDLVPWFQAGPDSALTNQPTILADQLAYSGLPASLGQSMKMGGGGGMGVRFQFGALTTGTVYYSFLCRINDITGLNATGVFWAGLNNSAGSQATTPTTAGARILTRSSGAGFQLGLDKGTGTAGNFVFDPTVFSVGDVILIVGRYTLNAGTTTDDETRLWLNPSSATFGAATEPSTSSLTNSTGTDQSQLASFVFLNRAADEPLNITIDEFRIGTNWAEVTASTADPNTLVKFDPSGLNGQPTQFQASMTNANVVASAITRGSGLTIPAGTSAAFNSSGWSGTNAATSLSSNDYCTFTIAPAANYSLAFTGIKSVVSRSGTGPDTAAWVYSQDGFTALLAMSGPVSTANGAPSALNGTLTDLGVTAPTEYRMLAWSNNVIANSAGTFRMGNAFPAVLSGSASLRAAGTLTWDGGGASDDWGDYNALAPSQGNWDLNKTPTPALVDNLVFAGTTRLTPNNNVAGLTVGSVTFVGDAGTFTLSGNAFTLNSGMNNGSASAQVINNAITLGSAQVWNAATAGWTIKGDVANGSFDLTVDGANDTRLDGVIGSGAGGLVKNGSGVLTLSGANTYGGVTLVSAGTLKVSNATGSGTGSGAVNLDPGTTLAGAGSIAGPVNAGGTVAPGNSVGTLTLGGSLTLTGDYALELNSSTPAADKIIAHGVTLAPGAQLTRTDLGGAALAPGTSFTIIDNTSADPVSGAFTGLPEGTNFVLGLNVYRISYLGGSGNDVVLMVTAIMGNHPPMAGDSGAATTAGRAVTLALAKLLENDSDPDGDPLTVISVSATSTNGGAVSLTSSNVTYTPLSGFNGVDRFTYTISDGRGGTASASVEVFVAAGNLPTQNHVSLTATEDGFLIRFAGIPGRTYLLQRSPDLNTWTTLATVVAPLHGIIEYEDTDPLPGMSFYRAAVP